jgi:integrase
MDTTGSAQDRHPTQALGRELAMLGRAPGVVVAPELLDAYAAAAAPNSLRAFRADVTAFDAWCHARGCRCLPASPQLAAGFLAARAGDGAAPASLTRYRASIAKLHRLCRLPDPCSDELVKLTLAAHRRAVGVAQTQARPLRFKGAVRDPLADAPRGINVRAALEACDDTLPGLRDRALLSVAYDTGLRASELVAIALEDIVEALDPDARLLKIARSKGDQEGEGATAYLSPRSVSALTRWLAAAGIREGAVFRRVIVRRYAAKSAISAQGWSDKSWNTRWMPAWEKGREARPARVEYDVGDKALHAGSVTPIFRVILRRAFTGGAFGDLDPTVFEAQLKQISAHSTRVGINQDYFAAGENLAGIMDALRWKSPRMPLLYNRNLAAEQGAAGRLLGKLE